MELQLGLALLPSNTISSFDHDQIPRFDLNEKGILISSDYQYLSSNVVHGHMSNKKRMFSDAFSENFDHDHHQDQDQDQDLRPKTLPLLFWNNQPNDEDDDPLKDLHKNTFSLIKDDEEDEEDGVVGWPPIKSWRKRLCCNIGGRSDGGNRTVENGCSCGERVSKFMYVKVQMEGMAIARKVDLSLHSCFETLMNTLMGMFGQEDSGNYKLTYQDRERDWLLAQDVSWRTFIRSVQRLKLLRRRQ